MSVLRTPDARFANLPGWTFTPCYTELDGGALGPLRMHHVDEGTGPVVLLLHGEPSWAYLYRRMIPPLVAAGARCLAPDLVGFGRSDKPDSVADYSYQGHLSWLTQWFLAADLRDVTLFCQDWGGLLGLRLVAEFPDRFARVVVSNSFLPTGEGKTSEAFLRWRDFSQSVPEFPAGGIVQGGTVRPLGDGVRDAYDAPYPDERHKAGARAFPLLVPTAPDAPEAAANRAAWARLERFDKPFLTAFGDSDPVTAGADHVLQSRVPGAKGQLHTIVERAGHFSQEDAGEELAVITARFMGLA